MTHNPTEADPRGIIPEANYRHVTLDERGEARPVPLDVQHLFQPVTFYDPTEEDRADFLAKVWPILRDACAEMGLPVTEGLMNLLCVSEPESAEEAEFRDELLNRIWAKYPGDAYPVMCWPLA